ncbi:ADP-ribosylglycohydrolase family protein [Microbacterium sp. M3]|uniref:ADP-ribosylglycohydrolase family protein n=1 Tax=Microbacterium arthrosphaerae TaxID=792652 RepID=A0ABU4H2R1_9MICO|nr:MULTISPECIES: ADP-ribosylglycohydrolase family protein [Microbacterium]MDW4572960.1 ADP-ribosylglycohydrolase family protein [Microbacterium arthrosphaerae]MDW7606815.1 ADP-ribosylglycohydrolase family protein [Microbacterium sp. M3]
MTPDQEDRAIGVVVASAAGDALGSQYEFGPALDDAVTPEFGVGYFGHARGEWTDDTSMAMPILRALADGRTLEDPGSLDGIVAQWRSWSLTAKDVGAQTRGVLAPLTTPTAAASYTQSEALHRSTGRSAGNGSLMRTGPVPLGYLHRTAAELAAAAASVSRLTHWEDDNSDACALWCLAIRHAVLTGGLEIRAGLDVVFDGMPQSAPRRARWEALIDEALTPGAHPRDFREGNGWVVRAFQSALAAVAGATSLIDALERAVRGGNDTDTVAAIAGSLAGAIHGANAVPQEWIGVLHGWPGIDAAELERLALRAAGPGGGVA